MISVQTLVLLLAIISTIVLVFATLAVGIYNGRTKYEWQTIYFNTKYYILLWTTIMLWTYIIYQKGIIVE